MNIGILSMQKILNYGSFLQAFSLKKQMEKRGHTVFFIDIEPGRQVVPQPANHKGTVRSRLDKYFMKRIENYMLIKRMKQIHIDDYETYLDTKKQLPVGEKYQVAIIGSDEVFNATVPSRWGVSSQLFGNIPYADHIITYAASCGQTTFDSATHYGIVEELREAMKRIEMVSVRDGNTYQFVCDMMNREAHIHLDPVFLTDFDEYIPPVKWKRPYLLVYAYGNRISNEDEIRAIKEYASAHHLDILCVGMQQRWCKHNIAANAFQLLGYVKNAACIVTDTFHGTVFSIKYNKQFAVFIRESNENKLLDLLERLGLAARAVNDVSILSSKLDATIDYLRVNQTIEDYATRAGLYLDAALKLGEN